VTFVTVSSEVLAEVRDRARSPPLSCFATAAAQKNDGGRRVISKLAETL